MNTYKMTLEDSVDSMTFDLLEVPIVDKDVEGAVDNTTLDGNIFTDYLWLKKNYVQKWSIMCDDEYSRLRGFYTRQFDNASVPTYKLYTGQNLSEDFIASGKYIMVDNTTDYNAPINSFQLLGDASQTTYSGKNKVYLPSGTYTSNGITWTVTDETIKANGTANSNWSVPMGFSTFPQPLPAGTYTFSIPSAIDKNFQLNLRDENGVSHDYNIIAQDTSVTFTTNFVATSFRYALRAGTGTTTNFTIPNQLQLEAGSSKTDFEPYVGGTASPNPDYPQAVNTVTGEQTVKIEGKNLFDINRTLGTPSNTSYANTTPRTFDFAQYVKGISSNNYYAPNNITSSDVSNGNITLKTTQSAYGLGFAVPTLPSTTYRISYNVTPAGGIASIGYYQKTGEWISNYSPSNGVFITPANCDFIVVSFRGSGDNVETTYSNIQLELGNQASQFEPYQGQTLAVNLGKNLLQPMTGLTNSGLTGTTNADGTINVTGTASSNYSFFTDTTAQNIPAGTYTFSDGLIGQTYRCIARFTYSDNTYVECDLRNQGAGKSFTLTKTAVKCQIRLTNIVSGTTYNLVVKPQVEKSTQSTAYAPFIHTSRNLFNKDTANTANGYLSGTTGAFVSGGGSYATQNATFLTAGKYIASQTLEKVCHYALDDSFIGLLERSGSNNEKFTMPEDGYVRLQFASSFNANTFQLEAGTVSTPYESYYAQLELAKIGNYQDRIYKTDSKWYIEKQVGKVVFDGTENWTAQGGGAPYTIDMPDFDRNTTEVRAISDNFLGVKYNANWNDYSSLITSNSSSDTVSRFKFRYTAITSLADWKTWLSTHPTTVYYALATPTTTEITNSELVGQLEAILQAYLYTGTNNISNNAVSPNLAGQMNLGYKLIFSEETVLIEPTAVRLTLTDGGIINVCGCRQNVQLTMRETIQ